MTQSPDPAASQKTLLETGKEYLDAAVSTVKAHPAASAGIAAGFVAAAAGTAYGVGKLRERNAEATAETFEAAEEQADIIDPQRVPEALPINGE